MDAYDVDVALQQALDRLSLLADAGTVLSSTLDVYEGLRRVGRILVRRLGDWCALDVLEAPGRFREVAVTRREAGDSGPVVTEGTGAVPGEADGPLARALRGVGPLLCLSETATEWQGGLPPHGLVARWGAHSAIVAPLRARREVLGALTIARTDPGRPLTREDLPLVEDLAHRVALAVDNAQLHQDSARIAERLQRSLLPQLPDLGGLRLAARYTPAQATAEVGGDWYDCFLLPQGDTTLIIGDVTGHDLHAAVTMAQLRNMLRGIACDRQEPPGHILRRLDVTAHTLYPTATATCLYALLKGPEGGPWEMYHAAAGHLPPLLVTRDGDTRFLTDGHGPMLGISPGAPRGSATDLLPAASTLLLYTDGLIERRGEGLDHSLTRLRQHAAALARAPVEVFCDDLLTGLPVEGSDDVALLALRLPGAAAQ